MSNRMSPINLGLGQRAVQHIYRGTPYQPWGLKRSARRQGGLGKACSTMLLACCRGGTDRVVYSEARHSAEGPYTGLVADLSANGALYLGVP